MNLAKKLCSEAAAYSIGPIFEKLIGIFLIPIYTAYLAPADYGTLQYIMTIGTFLVPFMGAGLATSYWRFRSDGQWRNGEVCLHVVLGQLAVGACISAFMILIYFNAYNTPVGLLLTIYIFSRVLIIIFESTLLVLQAHHRIFHYLVLSILYAASIAITSIVLIVYIQLNYSGVIYSIFFVTLIFSLLFSWPLIKEIEWKFDLILLKELYKYGIPLALANLSAIVIIFSDVLFLKWFSTDHQVGLYSFGYKFAMLVDAFLVQTFFKSWNPMRWEIYQREDSHSIFSSVYHGLLIFFPSLAMLVVAGAAQIAIWLTKTPDYLIGLCIIPIIGASYVFYAIYYYNSMGLLFTGKTKLISLIMLIAAGMNFLLNFLLIPKYGMYGASIATLFSYIFMAALSIILSQRLYKIERNSLLEIGQLFIMSIIVLSILKLPEHYITIPYKLFTICIMSSLILFFTGLLFNPKTYHDIKLLILNYRIITK